MNLHMERRMEVLAREIASRKAQKIDAAANAIFDEVGKKHEHKAPSDWVPKKSAEEKKLRALYDEAVRESQDKIIALSVALKAAIKEAKLLEENAP